MKILTVNLLFYWNFRRDTKKLKIKTVEIIRTWKLKQKTKMSGQPLFFAKMWEKSVASLSAGMRINFLVSLYTFRSLGLQLLGAKAKCSPQ